MVPQILCFSFVLILSLWEHDCSHARRSYIVGTINSSFSFPLSNFEAFSPDFMHVYLGEVGRHP